MIPYIIQVSIVLTCCLAFYKLLLKNETFYQVNRFILLFCMVIALGLPLVRIPAQFSIRKSETHIVTDKAFPTLQFNNTDARQPSGASHQKNPATEKLVNTDKKNIWFNDPVNFLETLYWFVTIIFIINFLFQSAILIYHVRSNTVIKDGKYRIVEIAGHKAPCSFLNYIFINPKKYEQDVYDQILKHEKIHVRQRHAIDILLAELILIFQWFNPFVWIYRKEVECNLEFLTDDQILRKENIEKSKYQFNLLRVCAPELPLALAINYNTSLLKKRIMMMNSKKSSIYTIWKYFFLIPLVIVLASTLNEPIAKAQNKMPQHNTPHKTQNNFSPEGYWLGTIQNDTINIKFSKNEDDRGEYFNESKFSLSDFKKLSGNNSEIFKFSREAGTMIFNGKFENDQGRGKYKFEPNGDFENYLVRNHIGVLDIHDMIAFFFVDITKEYVIGVKKDFAEVGKDNLIAMKSLNIDKEFIRSIKSNGYDAIDANTLISLKEVGVNVNYINEIKNAGYKDITAAQLLNFKVQGIDSDYLRRLPTSMFKDGKIGGEYVVIMKASNIDPEYMKSFSRLGYENIAPEELMSLKSAGITADYISQFHALGYKDISLKDILTLKLVGVTPDYIKEFRFLDYPDFSIENFIALKSQNITANFAKTFKDAGYKNFTAENLIAAKSLNIPASYLESFKEKGYPDISFEEAVSLKSQNITPEFLEKFAAIGFHNVSLANVVALKTADVTPEWIEKMKAKGFQYTDIRKYIELKNVQ
ncbi:MAG: M56 family metallopeptidase [Bacteroidetes bacterium]|nr:M56 family metallopeptidase [Bacteroidota bacterium]